MASINPYRYAGYRYDEETKLYYLMARYYNPDTGVFLSLDPVRGDVMNPITMNGYNYASNNPVMYVDPDGEFSIRVNQIINGINAAIALIPALSVLRVALLNRQTKRLNALLKTESIKKALINTTDGFLTKVKVSQKIRKSVKVSIVNFVLSAVGISIGHIVAWVLKRFVPTYWKYEKKFYYFGQKGYYEYFKFR